MSVSIKTVPDSIQLFQKLNVLMKIKDRKISDWCKAKMLLHVKLPKLQKYRISTKDKLSNFDNCFCSGSNLEIPIFSDFIELVLVGMSS